MPSNRRKSKPSGILTVVLMLAAAVLLIVAANLLRGMAQRRVSPSIPALIDSQPGQREGEPEIADDERRLLEKALRASETP